MKLINTFVISVIKLYQFFVSPLIGSNCRYLPTCSEYFIESLKINGFFKGMFLGIRRILKCHPIKILGGNSGYDPVPNLKKGKK